MDPVDSEIVYIPFVQNSANYDNSLLAVQAMAANLINIMTDPLKSLFPNSTIPTNLRDSIYGIKLGWT